MNTRVIGLWVLRIVLGLLFLATGLNKLLGNPMMVAMFEKIGLGQGFRMLTGCIEVAGALLTFVPRTSFYGALVLTAVAIGAFVTQVSILHLDFIHTIVLTIAAAALAWFQRPANLRKL